MSIGGFKAVKLRATTNKSTQSGVIIAYAANAKDTLTRVKDAIVEFGGWTWNEDLDFLSTTGYETDQYITYYTTLTHSNGAQLFISYGAAGVQFHWSCFAQYRAGSSSSYPTITENGTTYNMSDGQSGGWFSGLCMSMIPAGSSNHYGTPNRTDNLWMPSDATPIVGYLGTNNATYKEATTVSTAARMTSGNEYIYIINKDDLFMVMCHDPTWGGFSTQAGMGAPCYLGYVVGRLFDGLAPDDNEYYASYGWWNNQIATRITLGSPYLRGFSAAFPDNGSRANPTNLLNNATNSAGDFGSLGFFRKDGSKFSQSGPCGHPFIMIMNETQAGNAPRMYQEPKNARWYAIEVGVLPISDAAALTNKEVASKTQIKGYIRTDFMRGYVPVDPRYETRFRVPPYGTKFENGNFIMGPCNIAIGWDSNYTDTETEELCPWRGQSGFNYNSSMDFGGYQDIIQSIVSTGSKTFIAYTDYATKNTYVDSASLGGVTFDGTSQVYTSAGWYSLTKLIWDGTNLILSIVDSSNNQQYFTINASTKVATALSVQYSSGSTGVYGGVSDNRTLAACWNEKLNHYATAWTGWDSSGGENMKDSIVVIDSSGARVFASTTIADSFTGLVQDMCADIYGNIYIVYQDLGAWSGWSPEGATYNYVIQKLVWDSANSTYKFEANDGTLSSDNTTMWVQSWNIPCAIVSDKYGYIYILYRSWENPTGNNDLGVHKMKPDGTLIWSKHIGSVGTDIDQIRAIYTYDNKIHFSGQITGGAFQGFSQVNTTDTFFGTMTTDGMFAIKYQGGFTNGAVINTLCCDDGYDYIGVNELNNISNIKPKYALLKRTW